MNFENTFKLLDIFFRDNPNITVKHHLDSYNKFFDKDLKTIMKDNNPKKYMTELDDETNLYKYTADLYVGGKSGERVYYGKPLIYDKVDEIERTHMMFPNEARLRNMSYFFPIHYDLEIEFTILKENNEGKSGKDKFDAFKQTITIEKILLGRFPIMVKSYLCLLNGLNKQACFNLGECRNDKGGYFIIDGKEKAIVSQEERANNILYIKDNVNDLYSHSAEIRSASEDSSKKIRTLSVRIMAPQASKDYGNIVVIIPNVRKPVPLFILMRALGVISDKDIIQHCLLDLKKNEELIELFIPSVHDAGNIFTQQTALKYIKELTKGNTVNHVLDIFMNLFLPHIGELNLKHKALYLGYIVKRLLFVYIKAEQPTNRDKYNAKRIEHTGILLNQLFREFYTKQLNNIILKVDKEYSFKATSVSYQNEDFMSLFLNNQNMIFSDRLVEDGFKKAFKGNWGGETHTKRPGIVQSLNRLSFFSFMCQLRKTNINIGDATKMIEPRLINGTQYGLLCPLHSPDGGNVGLHKHMASSVHITNGVSSKPYINYLRKLNIILLEECSFDMMSIYTKIFLNGGWIGCSSEPLIIIETMKLHRRNNLIYLYTSILFDIKRNEIQIWVDAGRLCRPLIFIENKKINFLEKDVMQKIANKSLLWKEAVCGFNEKYNSLNKYDIFDNIFNKEELRETQGFVEYIDASEGESMILMKSITKNENIKNETHCEIHPSLILGFMANQIIFPENNPYPRNAFSCGQAKQGVSLYSTNYQNRIDKSAFILNSGQLPLTKSRYLNYFTNEEHPNGENAIVAIMCYSGYNVEDAVIINEASLKRGLFGTTYYNMYEDYEETSKIGSNKINKIFMNIEDNNVINIKEGYDYSKLDKETGIIKENTVLKEKTIIIGKAMNNIDEPNSFIDASIKCKKGQTGIVDKAFLTEGEEGERIAKVRIRASRIPNIGDKFCSRAGQKGTIGMILKEEDMPTTADGIKPDIIVNPHAMPSRMTIGHLVETLFSKTGAILGAFGDCTAFVNKGPKDKILGDILTENGYHSSGNEIMYNGMTGEQLECDIYLGPTYYLRLKHMPKDKINYRARGPRSVLTRQTVGGRANDGGLRIGEMDRDCLIAHGLSYFVMESMMVRGDQFYMAVCNKTGTIAVYNENKNLFLSPVADGPLKFVGNLDNEKNIVQKSIYGKDFSIVKVPYAFKLLMQELKTMNVQMRLITEDSVDKLTTLYYGHKLIDNGFMSNNKKELVKDYRKTFGYKKEKNVPVKYTTDNGLDYWEFPGNKKMSPEKKQRFKDVDNTLKDKGIDYGTIVVDGEKKEEYGIIDEEEIKEQRKKLEEDDDNMDTIGVDEILGNNLQEELSNNLEVGSIVKLRQRGKLFSKENFTIMGFDKRDNEYLIRNPKTGEVLMKEKDDLLTGISSLEDPRNLKIGDKAELKLDTINEEDENSSDFTPVSPNYAPSYSNDIPEEELNVEEYDEDTMEEMIKGVVNDEEGSEKINRTVLNEDETNKDLNFLSPSKEEEKEEYTDEQNKNLVHQTLMYKRT
jgi:DNA-directed RNA polymerase II subunit RPB2